MGQLTTKFIFNRSGVLDNKGRGLIQIRLTISTISKFISTGIRVEPKFWHGKKGRIRGHNNAINLNLILSSFEDRAFSCYQLDLVNGDVPSLEKIAMFLKRRPFEDQTVNSFFWNVFKSRIASKNTLKQHKVFLGFFDRFKPMAEFHMVNYDMLVKFESWLSLQDNYRGGNLSRNYISSMLRILRIYVNEAIRHQKINVNPFLGFRIVTTHSKITHLSFLEVEQLEKVDVSERRGFIPETKDMFLFACYTSLRFSDLCTLQVKHFERTDEGLILKKKPIKTKKSPSIHNVNLSKLFWGRPEQLILKHLEGKDKLAYVFGPHDQDSHNTSYNRHLEIIREMAGLDKKLTSHVARHTCAMMLLNEFNFSIEDVSTIMAHSDISITQKYARVRYDRLDRAIEDKFKKE